MELTRKEKVLIEKIRAVTKDNESSVLCVRYTPIGESGHVQTISHGELLPITGLRTPLVNLLKDIKKMTSNSYTVLAVYDEIVDALQVYKMNSVKDTVARLDKSTPPIPRKKRKYTRKK